MNVPKAPSYETVEWQTGKREVREQLSSAASGSHRAVYRRSITPSCHIRRGGGRKKLKEMF